MTNKSLSESLSDLDEEEEEDEEEDEEDDEEEEEEEEEELVKYTCKRCHQVFEEEKKHNYCKECWQTMQSKNNNPKPEKTNNKKGFISKLKSFLGGEIND